jgi:hypothetical protein
LSNNVTWIKTPSLVQVAPKEVTDVLTTIEGVTKVINDALNIVIGILEFIKAFFSGGADFIIDLLKSFMTPFITMLQDILGLGGGLIFIHPFNRMNKRTVNASKTPGLLMNIPAMNAQEALNEFYASFSNQNDPFRPQWSANSYAAGIGFLLVCPEPKGLLDIVNAFLQIIDIKEFQGVVSSYTKNLTAWAKDTEVQFGPIAKNFTKFDITGLHEKNITTMSAAGNNPVPITKTKLVFDESLPSLHWYGLSLSNFMTLSSIQDGIELLIEKLLSFLQTTDNAIVAFIDILIKKIKAIQEIVQIVSDMVSGFIVSLSTSGLYTFIIPQGLGGTDYIINQLKDSIAHPQGGDASTLKNQLTTHDFCALFFMGASVGVNLSAWESMIAGAFDTTSEAAVALSNLLFSKVNYTVIPDFKNKVFNFNTPITLQVVSQDSTPNTQLYYTYSITGDGTLIAANTLKLVGESLKVNIDSVPLYFPLPSIDAPITPANITSVSNVLSSTYTITIEIFDFLTVNEIYTTSFNVIDSASDIKTRVDNNHVISLTSKSGGNVSIVNSNHPSGGYALEKSYVSPGNTIELGSLTPPFNDGLLLSYSGSDGSSFTTPIQNNVGYRVADLDSLPIPNSFRFLTLPGKICFNFEGALKIKGPTDSDYTYITLPACITISILGNFTYYLFTTETGWQGPFTFGVVEQVIEGTQIC